MSKLWRARCTKMTTVKFHAIVREQKSTFGKFGKLTNKALAQLVGKRVVVIVETELKGQ